MPSQTMPLRKNPTPGGKAVELPEKSHLLSPTSHHLQVSLLLTAPKCGAAPGRRGSNARRRQVLQVGRAKAELQGGRLWSGL